MTLAFRIFSSSCLLHATSWPDGRSPGGLRLVSSLYPVILMLIVLITVARLVDSVFANSWPCPSSSTQENASLINCGLLRLVNSYCINKTSAIEAGSRASGRDSSASLEFLCTIESTADLCEQDPHRLYFFLRVSGSSAVVVYQYLRAKD